MEEQELIKKWSNLVEACKRYYVDSLPTGILDSEYDALERQALIEDGFSVRDYVFRTYTVGRRVQNHYITKFGKSKVEGKMLDAMQAMETKLGKKLYWLPKYDGSSIAVYLNPKTGRVKNIVGCGNLNLCDEGIDQTWKLIDFIPKSMPVGIAAIQCEAIIDLRRLSENPERARQKTNGLINSKYCDTEVNSLLTLIGYRYYFEDPNHPGKNIPYKQMIESGFKKHVSPLDGHVMFKGADVWTLDELKKMPPGYTETDKLLAKDGSQYLIDGWIYYDQNTGECLGGLKFAGAGSGDNVITTTVKSIQWNNQVSKGKDSWSANVLIEPIHLGGVEIKKPSAGSVSKLLTKNITPGAEVSIILANSTIPMVGDCYKPGNGDYMWPTCSCGYKMGSKDIYGSLLKCGNSGCTERLGRMRLYVESLSDVHKDLDLNKLLVLDRFKWEKTGIDMDLLLSFIEQGDSKAYYDYLKSFLTTDLQKRNLDLVWKASFTVLREVYEKATAHS